MPVYATAPLESQTFRRQWERPLRRGLCHDLPSDVVTSRSIPGAGIAKSNDDAQELLFRFTGFGGSSRRLGFFRGMRRVRRFRGRRRGGRGQHGG